MALVDDIEFYGRAAAAGDMLRPAAVAALVRDSRGRLTALGASRLIDDWQTARGRYRALRDETRAALALLRDRTP